MHETNPRTSFSNRWFRSVGDTCHVIEIDTCQTSHSYPLLHDATPKYGTTHDEFSWVGGWKIQRFRLCSVEHPILDSLSDLSNEQIRSLRKALLRYFF
jgi:hypothetical protein